MLGIDIKKIEKEIAGLKDKKQKLLSDIENLSQEVVSYLAEIARYKEEANKQKQETQSIVSGNVEIAKQLSEKKAELRKVEGLINQDASFLDEREKSIKKKEEEYAWTVRKTEEAAALAKERERAATEIIKEANKSKSEADKAKDEFERMSKEMQSKISAIGEEKEKNANIAIENAKVADQNNRLGHQLKEEINEVKVLRDNLAEQIRFYQEATNKAKDEVAALDFKKQELDSEIKKQFKKADSLEKEAAALRARDNELKLTQLRMDKIIREKDIAAEIERLESNAK